MTEASLKGSKYIAFLSHSSKDKKAARKLQRDLERYRFPPNVHGSSTNDRKLGRIFLDVDDMAAAPSLGSMLEGAIDQSENLIVLCSPSSANSDWVDAEVRRFKRRQCGSVFAVILDGRPNSNVPITECFCPALKYQVGQDGEVTTKLDEPFAPDLRIDGNRRLLVKLATGLKKIDFDDVWKRDRRRILRRRFTGTIFTTTVLVVLSYGIQSYNRTVDIRRIETPVISAISSANQAEQVALLAEKRVKDISKRIEIANRPWIGELQESADAEVIEGIEGYAGGITYRGSARSSDLAWLDVEIHYTSSGALYRGEIPFTDTGQFVGQGGAITQKYGVYYYPPQCVYDYECENPNGEPPFDDVYIGSFVDFDPDGFGRYTFEDGSSYIGEIAKDAFDGWGVFRTGDGTEWVGRWARNKSIEPGFVRKVDGTVDFGTYKGKFLAKKHPPEVGE